MGLYLGKKAVVSVIIMLLGHIIMTFEEPCDTKDCECHTCLLLWIVGTSHRRNGFYTAQHQPYT